MAVGGQIRIPHVNLSDVELRVSFCRDKDSIGSSVWNFIPVSSKFISCFLFVRVHFTSLSALTSLVAMLLFHASISSKFSFAETFCFSPLNLINNVSFCNSLLQHHPAANLFVGEHHPNIRLTSSRKLLKLFINQSLTQ